MARKQQGSKKRSSRKILDAFQIAERAENGGGSDSDDGSGDDLVVRDGIMDASRLLGKKSNNSKRGKRGDDSGSELEDEEIDSDEALGSDDDYDVLNSTISQSIRDKQKKMKTRAKNKRMGKDILDSEESEDEGYNSLDESQLVGLSEAWDMDDKDLKSMQKSKSKADNEVVLDDKWESESEAESESESESESEDEEESDSDVFDVEEGSDVDLTNTVSQLQSKLKKPSKERKRLLTEKTDENEFNLPTKGAKLSLNDMIAGVDSSITKDTILIDKDTSSNSGSGVKTLSAPLPKRIQERHDRSVAYDITKEEVSKWEDIVQQNRQAEVLQFPMNPTTKHNDSALTFKSDNKPTTELEQKVHNLLTESSLLDDKKEQTFEEIATAKLSLEEMKKRNNELKLMRELMFREEKRAKRIKKIKSKQYHKIQKKERLRNQEMVEGSDFEEEDGEDHDVKRAQERMSLKHKTQSQWAKSMIKSGLSKDASNRGELEEMLRQGERLRAKQLGHEEGEQSDNGVSDIEGDYENEEAVDEDSRSKLGKGVLNMDFMKEAEKRSKAENLKELEFLRKMEETGGELGDLELKNSSVNETKNQGRRVYTPSASSMKSDMSEVDQSIRDELEIDQSKSLSNRLSGKVAVVSNKQTKEQPKVADKEVEKQSEKEVGADEDFNPWMVVGDEGKKSTKISVVDQTSSKLSKASAKISKHSKKRTASTMDSEDSVIDVSKTLNIVDAYGSDNDAEEDAGDNEKGNLMFRQKDLIKEAFAGDDVITEFDAEKRQVIADEDDKEEDVTLPGWGDWAGSGSKKSKKKKIVRKIDGVVQKDKRKDKNLKNVIINEKVNKKNLKYQSSAVPFPYESREQYERALRMPVGQEWTSRDTHQKLTMPRVITKQGTVIDPLKAPFK